ncbi:MAG: autotransporter domain-containing protein [Elusimicrobia bacterium]|nr:autotransporter domain-containing protein [Elusimicrobiota bacterium]
MLMLLAALLLASPPAVALSPSFQEAITMAALHNDSPSGWVAPYASITKLTGADADASIKTASYDAGKIIVRSATQAWKVASVYAGKATTVYGSPTTSAYWVTTGDGAQRFLLDNGVSGDATKLIERGLGMNDTGGHDAYVEYAVIPDLNHIMRPAKNPDTGAYSTSAADYGTAAAFQQPAGMGATEYGNFKTYYTNWVHDALDLRTFPFSALGYTFFWGNGSTLDAIRGMSEFIILGGTALDVYSIYATPSFIYTRNDGSVFSSAAGSQFGNGFASFDVTGACPSIWAGHRFQRNVRTGATPNQVIVEGTGSVSGGSGILVWSLNYDVTNNGSITGATTSKFGIAGTSDIGILFQGDTSTTYGTPLAGINKLTNSGTISSPGTAVQALAGDTTIINNAGGSISGGSYAILTGAGNDAVTVHGGVVSGRIDLGGGTNSLTVDGAARLGFTLDPAAKTAARVANPGTVNISDDKLTLEPSVTGNVVNGDSFLVVDATALTADAAKVGVRNDPTHPMLSFAVAKTGNQLSLVATRDNGYYAGSSGNISLGSVLDGLAGAPSGDMAAVLAALDGSGRAADARQLQPGVDNGALAAAQQTQTQFLGSVMGHLEGLGSGSAPAGAELDPAVWSQGLGSYLHQSPRGQSNGYDASIWGLSGGYDTEVSPGLVLGLGAGYAHDQVRSADSGGRSNVDSYQGSAYAGLSGPSAYVDGLVSIAYNQYDSTRRIAFGGLDRTARSVYNGRQYTGYAEGGLFREARGLKLTPLASLQYTHLQTDAYTEVGAGAADLAVAGQDYDLLESGLGFKLSYPRRTRSGEFAPDFHARWLYDIVAQSQQAQASFAGGGPAFTTDGFTPARSGFDLGGRLALTRRSGLSVLLDYDLVLKEAFSSHSGALTLRYSF